MSQSSTLPGFNWHHAGGGHPSGFYEYRTCTIDPYEWDWRCTLCEVITCGAKIAVAAWDDMQHVDESVCHTAFALARQ